MAEDLQPATVANSNQQGAAEAANALGNQPMENGEAHQEGTWWYKTRKLYKNQPTSFKYIILFIIIAACVIIMAGIGVAIHKAVGKTEVQHLIVTQGGTKYKVVVVLIDEFVFLTIPHIKNISTGPSTGQIDFANKLVALNDQAGKWCFLMDVERSLESMDMFRDALERSWTESMNLSATVTQTKKFRALPLSSNIASLINAHYDYMDCEGGYYEVLKSSQKDPTAGAGTGVCHESCFPNFIITNMFLTINAKNCFFFGDCNID